MIARLTILLPFHLTVPESVLFNLYRFSSGDYDVEFRPPVKSDKPVEDAPDSIEVDGKPAYLADVLVIYYRKADFNRKEDAPLDPPEEIIQDSVNWFLSRLRYVVGAPAIRPVDFPRTTWRLDYLTDDEKDLPIQEGNIKGRGALIASFSWIAVNSQVWDSVFTMPDDFKVPAWETLLLDAKGSLPEVGQTVVLAATALEVFIAAMLDRLAALKKISPTLWSWINERGFLKEPSLEEQYDVLLLELLGVTLKQDAKLWQEFMELKQARNTFVHSGVPLIGKSQVTPERAAQLVQRASEVVNFVKQHLPEELRWPKPEHKARVQVRKVIRRAAQPPAADD